MTFVKRVYSIILITTGVFLMVGCSSLNPFSADEKLPEKKIPQPAEDTSEDAGSSVAKTSTESVKQYGAQDPVRLGEPGVDTEPVEVLWATPSETEGINGYVIEYGFDTNFSRSVTVTADELRAVEHPVFGPVYRVYLQDVILNTPLLVRIRAISASGISEPSDVFRILPGTGWGKRLNGADEEI